jgi:predicted nucleotidyltransferase
MSAPFFGPLGDGFAAADGEELRSILARVDATVPPRTGGSRAEHRERYCIVHYLRTLERHGLLQFPFRIAKTERPDFELEMGSFRSGLEVTDAGSEDDQRAATELERSSLGSFLDLESSKVRSRREALEGRGFIGDEPQRLWTEYLLAAIRRKEVKKLPGYAEFPEYHLLIYDNSKYLAVTGWTVSELPERLATALREWRASVPDLKRRFACISVLRDRVLLFDVTGRGFLLPVPPSPSQPELLPLTRLGISEQELQALCLRHQIRELGFFGSIIETGERFGSHSDVDVLVEFEPDARIGLVRLAGIEQDLSRLLGRKADLRTVPDLSRYFRDEVVREKTELAYAHDSGS